MAKRRRMTFPDVAAQLGVTICGPNDLCRQSQIDHDRGEYSLTLGMVHWRERRMTKAGLYRFLRLVALAKHPDMTRTITGVRPTWQRTYLIHRQVNVYARMLHVRIPFDLTREARARVKSSVLDVPRRTPLRREAFQWARRMS